MLGGEPTIAAAWDALAAQSANIFATREWLGTWERHEPSEDEVVLITTRRADGSVAALLPLRVHRRRPTVLRPLGPWPPPEGPLICAGEDYDWAVRDAARQLVSRGGWDTLEFDAVPVDQSWREVLRVVRVSSSPNHVIELQGRSWEELLAASSRNFRSQYSKRTRRLERKYDVRVRRADDPVRLGADVDAFLRLHWLRWKERINVLTPARREFLQEFAASALERDWLALWLLELDGTTVAANLNFRFAGREVFFMAGSDPAFAEDRVGFALTFHAIREAATAGIREFHFLRGDEQHKTRLPSVNRPVEHIVASRTVLGDATLALEAIDRRARIAASSRLPPAVKHVVRRILP